MPTSYLKILPSRITLLLTTISFVIFGCSKEVKEKEITMNEVSNIAEKYNFSLSSQTPSSSVYKINSLKELEETLSILTNVEAKGKSLLNSNLDLNILSIETKLSLLLSQIKANTKNDNEQLIKSNDYAEGGGTVYKYQVKVRFDNNFPSPNYYVTIDYNTNGSGQITGAQITTGTYGMYIGGSYSQNTVNLHYQGGSLVFQIDASMAYNIGIGSWTLNNSIGVNFTGYLQLGAAGGTISDGAVVQRKSE